MGELLAIQEAARRLGVSTDTLRQWARAGRIEAVRTEGGHRRFRAEDVQRLVVKRDGVQPGAEPAAGLRGPCLVAPRTSLVEQSASNPLLPSYWQERIDGARARAQVVKLNREARENSIASQASRDKAQQEAEEAERRQQHQRQLQGLRAFGRSLAADSLPADVRAEVAADLEAYVSVERFSFELPEAESREYVAARIREFVRRHQERQAEEASKQARERELASQTAHVAWLRQLGLASARSSTNSWRTVDQAEAMRELEKELRDAVGPDWTLARTLTFVDEVLAEFDEEDDDQADEEEEEDDDDDLDDDEE